MLNDQGKTRKSDIEQIKQIAEKLNLPLIPCIEGKKDRFAGWGTKEQRKESVVAKIREIEGKKVNLCMRLDDFVVLDIDDFISASGFLHRYKHLLQDGFVVYKGKSPQDVKKLDANGHIWFKRPQNYNHPKISIQAVCKSETSDIYKTSFELLSGASCVAMISGVVDGKKYKASDSLEKLSNLPYLPNEILQTALSLKEAEKTSTSPQNQEFNKILSSSEKKDLALKIADVMSKTSSIVSDFDSFRNFLFAFKSVEGLEYREVDHAFQNSSNYDYKSNEARFSEAKPNRINIFWAYKQVKEKNKDECERVGLKIASSKKGFIECDTTKKTFYFETKTGRDGKEYISKEIHCNFIMRFVERRRNDKNELCWIAKLENHEDSQEVVIDGSIRGSGEKFSNEAGRFGDFLVYRADRKAHSSYMEFVVKASDSVKNVRSTNFLGRISKEAFLFSNKIVMRDGTVKDPKSAGIIPPESKQERIRLVMPDGGDLKQHWQKNVEDIHKIFGSASWKILGFAAATLFREEVIKELPYFPLLQIYGQAKTGKSWSSRLLASLFGASRLSINDASTKIGMMRRGSRLRSIPIVKDEYHGTEKENKLFLQWYDLQGYVRAEKSNDLNTSTVDINSSLVVTGTRCMSGFEAEAVTSRFVVLDTSEFERSEETKALYANLMREGDKLASFVAFAFANMDVENILEKVRSRSIELGGGRVGDNVALIEVFYCELMKSLDMTSEIETTSEQCVENVESDLQQSNYLYKFLIEIRADLDSNNPQLNKSLIAVRPDGILVRSIGALLSALRYRRADLPSEKDIVGILKSRNVEKRSSRKFQEGFVHTGWFLPKDDLQKLGIISHTEELSSGSGFISRIEH